ncbi:outer membrane protein [Thioalkalivibrio sulfidiphilus HL-EbGr7]|uniref:Outer membrane protein n=1 Tax=Thioalkalivibrio sulfidiphilus (strain HL-EbGR7) TaxID=396588 RepID=B8GLS3_THISH|nr:lipid A deacylase LpxR family protein [Thioalkalivibrio sulfidiphilus]ACL71676.1 outer membrane protein [Thioalkalivibrio sulfidiphilus HL-EbGr7]
MPRTTTPLLLLLQASLALTLYWLASPAQAAHPPERQNLWVLDIENDWFAGTDRYYTGGLRVTRIRAPGKATPWARTLADALPMFTAETRLGTTTALGQNAYTPADKDALPPNPEDRPYAGWLHFTAGLDGITDHRLDRLHLTVGVVGPASLVDRTQRLIHEVTGPAWPRGWEYQLHNEPTLMLSYERQWHALDRGIGQGGWEADFTPHAGGSLGTPFTFLNAGFTIRAGRDLPWDYGPPRIQPGLAGSGIFQSRPGLHGYGFAGVDVRLVGVDLFLDGNTWRDSPSVDKDPWVGDLFLGFALGMEHVRVSYTHVVRTREFRSQESRQNFGALSISWIH